VIHIKHVYVDMIGNIFIIYIDNIFKYLFTYLKFFSQHLYSKRAEQILPNAHLFIYFININSIKSL